MFLERQRPVELCKKIDILAFIDFIVAPKKNWLSAAQHKRFELHGGYFVSNKLWAPFVHTNRVEGTTVSQQTIQSAFTALNAWFKHLNDEEILDKNIISAARKDCKHLIRGNYIKPVKRLSDLEWNVVLETAQSMADTNPKFERNLFLIASLKVLYLRISELSERPNWTPVFSHFWQQDGYWWLRVFGKGNKIRDVSIPDSYLAYLERYRLSRGLTPRPSPDDHDVIITKLKGHGGLTARQLRRLVQEVFDLAVEKLKSEGFIAEAQTLAAATTHWLRHTGASMDVENNRNIKHLADDLGHASVATTDKVYVQSDIRERAESGYKRKV